MEPEVILEEKGAAGVITLNRPKALNALTLPMVREIIRSMRHWAAAPAITRVIIKGAGEKAFCAGGDVRWLCESGSSGRVADALAFWREEYVLNHYIGCFPKPYVSLIDGICMGGGFGISAHGAHRVAGDRYLFAMPEVGIGLFPDVGGTHVLPRLPGAFGTYLALTGARIRGADAYAVGLATDVVPSAAFSALEAALVGGAEVERAIADHRIEPGPGPLAERLAFISVAFARPDVVSILAALDEAAGMGGADGEFAAATAAEIRTKSPTSLSIAMEQIRRGPALDLAGCLKAEFRAVNRVAAGHDFYEGVRAALIDRDHVPRWRPATLADVDPEVIAAHFAPIDDELELLAPGA
ncbi:enoyl-CoA hydratase/isomerase family protein [Xanthobacter pseudotagetidis]|uniref:enoyl-CoA hydratase/isomerase family protein n=1 Tax=Xanthobacter pseudotagetidis TaxID=3119911 RepID=UPI0037291221